MLRQKGGKSFKSSIKMIRHIVFFTAQDPKDLDTIEFGLKRLETIPDSIRVEIRRNMNNDPVSPDGPDIVVYGEFEDEAQLAAYKAHPLYLESTSIVRPLREMRISADFIS